MTKQLYPWLCAHVYVRVHVHVHVGVTVGTECVCIKPKPSAVSQAASGGGKPVLLSIQVHNPQHPAAGLPES